MTNSKKRLFTVLAVAIVLCVSIIVLTACNTDSVVQFMVQDENDEWQVLSSQTVGKKDTVSAPTAPVKDFYEFVDWYTDENFTTPFSSGTVAGNVNVYAKYNPVEVSVQINNDAAVTKNLADVANLKYNPGKELEFDGWYKDPNCTVKWDNKEVVQNLYARTVAKITFTNGWTADDYIVRVEPGETIDITENDFEINNIVKSYMSDKDIEYVDENGVTVDFSKPFEKNTTINVLWNSKGLKPYKVLPNSTEGHSYLYITSFDDAVKNAPILSFRNKITTDKTEIIDYIKFYAECMPDSVKKIIIGDGIQAVQGMNGVAASQVQEIVLPKSLKILDNSFNNMPNLKGVTLSEGLEVLIGSFFVDAAAHSCVHTLGRPNPNYEIVIPDSVKNIAMMPNNLKFSKTEETAEKGDFYKGEDGRIYLKNKSDDPNKDGKKVLISDPAAFKNIYNAFLEKVFPYADTIVVPEGVEGIQVGTYNVGFDYLELPSTFKFVNYNANMADYKEIYDIYHEGGTNEDGSTYINNVNGNALFDKEQFEKFDLTQPSISITGMEYEAFAITRFVGGAKVLHPVFGTVLDQKGAGQVIFKTSQAPAGLELAFVIEKYGKAVPMSQLLNDITFVDDKNVVNASCEFTAPDTFGMGKMLTTNVLAKIEGKDTITEADIKEALIAANPAIEAHLADATIEFYANNKKITLGDVKSDLYITVKIIKSEAKLAA